MKNNKIFCKSFKTFGNRKKKRNLKKRNIQSKASTGQNKMEIQWVSGNGANTA